MAKNGLDFEGNTSLVLAEAFYPKKCYINSVDMARNLI
jgi:hypothetical protein